MYLAILELLMNIASDYLHQLMLTEIPATLWRVHVVNLSWTRGLSAYTARWLLELWQIL